MFIPVEDRSWLTAPFAPISLKELEANSGMLERIDNKYVVNHEVLRLAVPELAKHFDILEIDGLRNFTYDTCYFDDADSRCYFDHHQARKKRVKVRMRKYLEAGLCFVEVKLKDRRGMTIKKRLRCAVDKYGTLDEAALNFVNDVYQGLYKRVFPHDISRNLDMRYQRLTLVAKDGGERMTLDNSVRFIMDGEERGVDEELFIIEAKSAKGNGIADRILRRLHQHPTKHVSKYCTGLATMREGTKRNNFRRALKSLGLLDAPETNETELVRKAVDSIVAFKSRTAEPNSARRMVHS
jgi:VTC domain